MITFPESTETGRLQIMHLKRYWSKAMAKRSGALGGSELLEEWPTDTGLLASLGLGLEQVTTYLFNTAPSFDEFEDWILDVNGGHIAPARIHHFNGLLTGESTADTALPNVLSAADLAFWGENGYVILKGAVPREDCDQTVALICEHLGIDRSDPATWYASHKDRQGIMVQLFQHEQLQRNRDTPIIRQAFQQLWGRNDVWVNTDRVGFNPPETATYRFPGPKLHWDVSLAQPMPFGTQGILYLADTAANQGAFTMVPGFNHKLAPWLKSLPPGTNPRTEDLYALGAVPVAANAGDFILWHQALPHGASPNTSALPRFVQYINYQPIDLEIREEWI
jgi:hypothetical protein